MEKGLFSVDSFCRGFQLCRSGDRVAFKPHGCKRHFLLWQEIKGDVHRPAPPSHLSPPCYGGMCVLIDLQLLVLYESVTMWELNLALQSTSLKLYPPGAARDLGRPGLCEEHTYA